MATSVSCCNQPEETCQWAPAGDKIMTTWAEQVDPANVLPEYPRPQLVRADWQNLNGLWDYAITEKDAKPEAYEGKILVPFAVESALSGVGRPVTEKDALWYSREFRVPRQWKGKRVMLNFGAVDWHAQVYVDGQLVGEHKGGYDPFSFDVTDYLAKGKTHNLTVRVYDQTNLWYQPCGKQIFNPRGIWYTPVTGIWQTVWMEPVEAAHVESYMAVSDLSEGKVKVSVEAAGLAEGDVCKVELYDGQTLVAEAEGLEAELAVAEPKLWSPDSPFLYDLKLTVLRNGKVLDQAQGYTAMREITVARDEAGHKRMLLNGEALFHYGPLDQGWWPDGLYTAPTDEALAFDIEKTKEFGYNMIRKHVKVEPARWYWHCDRLGMLVWQDMPSPKHGDNKWGRKNYDEGTDSQITQEGKDNFYNEWAQIINDFKVFPSIVVWVPFNEAWGQFDTPEVVAYTKKFDPTRLVNESSGGNFHLVGDIIDVHHYPHPAMNAFESKFINVLGEYGGIGYPVEGHTWEIDRKWGYGKNKQSSEEVMQQYAEYAEMLKVFVQTGCAAAVYTQTTDVEGEVNGLMTYDRKVIKVDIPKLAEINRSVIESMSK